MANIIIGYFLELSLESVGFRHGDVLSYRITLIFIVWTRVVWFEVAHLLCDGHLSVNSRHCLFVVDISSGPLLFKRRYNRQFTG